MHTADDDARYFAERARQERHRAQQSSPVAQIVHLELAQLYEQRRAVSSADPSDQAALLE